MWKILIYDLIEKIAGSNVIKRHENLEVAIGYFPEEDEAYHLAKLFRIALPVAVIGATACDMVLVFSYMKWIHPWSRIIQSEPIKLDPGETIEIKRNEKNVV